MKTPLISLPKFHPARKRLNRCFLHSIVRRTSEPRSGHQKEDNPRELPTRRPGGLTKVSSGRFVTNLGHPDSIRARVEAVQGGRQCRALRGRLDGMNRHGLAKLNRREFSGVQLEVIRRYLAKFDGDLAGARQIFFAIVLTSGSVLEPVERLQGISK